MPQHASASNDIPLQPATAAQFIYDKKSLHRPAPHNAHASCFLLPSSFLCDCLSISAFLPFAIRHQKRIVASPSINSPQRMRRRWLVLDEFAKYAFFGLKRKRRDFERSVLKYVSIKIPALTHSGRKSRVCVNQPDRLFPHPRLPPSCIFALFLAFCLSPKPSPNRGVWQS